MENIVSFVTQEIWKVSNCNCLKNITFHPYNIACLGFIILKASFSLENKNIRFAVGIIETSPFHFC